MCPKQGTRVRPITREKQAPGGPQSRRVKPVDSIFGPLNIQQRVSNDSENAIRWSYNERSQLINMTALKLDRPDKLIAKTKIVEDKLSYDAGGGLSVQERVIYETSLAASIGNGLLARSSSSSNSYSSGMVPFSDTDNNFYQPALPHFLMTINFSDSGNPLHGVMLFQQNRNPISKFYLGLTKDQNDALIQLADSNKLLNTHVFLIPKSNNNHFISLEGIRYGKFLASTIGEDDQGELKVLRPAEDIVLFTFDMHEFFSREYVEHMPELAAPINRQEVLTIFNNY